MMKCEVCGKTKGFLASLTGVSHAQCDTMPVLRQIDRGEFRSFDDDAEILLENDEHCLAVAKGCALADPQTEPAEVGKGNGTPGPGSEARQDGLVTRDVGSLFVTNRRMAFMGTFDARTIPLGAIVDIRHTHDTLMIVAGERQAASYFIMTSPRRLEITAAVIKKLAELLNTNQKPTVYEGPRRVPRFELAS